MYIAAYGGGSAAALAKAASRAHIALMPKTDNRSCTCGAVYRRIEAIAAAREIGSYECAVCGATLESWNTAWVPSYRLIVGPIRKPE